MGREGGQTVTLSCRCKRGGQCLLPSDLSLELCALTFTAEGPVSFLTNRDVGPDSGGGGGARGR